jgi:hypothetical protein
MQADDMTRVVPLIKIVPEEYDAFVRLIPGDERLPRSYDEWLRRSAHLAAESDARGDNVRAVAIHSEEFAYYCLAKGGRDPTYALLEELAAEKVASS